MRNNKGARLLVILAALLMLVTVFTVLQGIFMPKYSFKNLPEGALVAEYYDEKNPHDVLFVGDCEVYENYSPVVLWEQYGVTSYIRGSAQQLVWQSYYLLAEMLEQEQPAAVVYNIQAMQYGVPQDEAYNRLTLDGMKLSSHKRDAIRASMMDDEEELSYYLPLLRYHARWSELNSDDVRYCFKPVEKVSHNGFLMRSDTLPAGMQPTVREKASYEFGEAAWEYLDKMTALCKDKGVELILVKAPALRPYWYPEWDAQITDYAKANGLTYINFIDLFGLDTSGNEVVYSDSGYEAAYLLCGTETALAEPIADEDMLDFSTDTYDGGQHMNLSGAEKLTRVFGNILTSAVDIPDHSSDTALCADWAEKSQRYYDMLSEQQRELEQYGWLKSFGASAPED